MNTTRFTSALVAGLILAGCASAPTDEGTASGTTPAGLDEAGGKADQINGSDDPSGLLGSGAERRLSQLISGADIGQSFGVPEDEIPYPDTYWPMVDNGIAVEWLEMSGEPCDERNGCDDPQPSPLEKFVAMTNPNAVQEAVAWETANHGLDVPGVADWFGHCPGWVATAMLYPPVQNAVWVRNTGLQLEKCEEGEEDCTKFEIGDVNALGAEAHEGARSRFIGARCDTDPADVERDEFGRIVRNGSGCKGLNAGAMLIVMGNRLKIDGEPFAIDAQNEFTTEQIWNQPTFRYTVNDYEALTESEAANLVATGGDSRQGDRDVYPFNSNAEGFVLVDVSLNWVTETSGPNLTPVSGADSFRTTRMVAVIELDADPSNPDAEIIGGEYIDDGSVGADRLRVAPFAWIAEDAGPDFRHNPFVRANTVKQLLALALSDDDDGSGQGNACAHDLCDEGVALDAACDDSCAADICAVDAYCCNNSWDSICVDEVSSVCGRTCD